MRKATSFATPPRSPRASRSALRSRRAGSKVKSSRRVPARVPAPYTGRCLCGEIEYRLNSEPVTYYACHCTNCQKRSGTAFALSLWVKRGDLQVTKGEPVLRVTTAVDGKPRHMRECAKCGTRLWSERPE